MRRARIVQRLAESREACRALVLTPKSAVTNPRRINANVEKKTVSTRTKKSRIGRARCRCGLARRLQRFELPELSAFHHAEPHAGSDAAENSNYAVEFDHPAGGEPPTVCDGHL